MNQRKLSQSIGKFPFCREEMIDHLGEFSKIYENRPIRTNTGGQGAAQLFYSWFVAKKLKPSFIIESGVHKGQGTWAFEQASPKSQLVCLDPYPQHENGYKSDSAVYMQHDFASIDWENIDKNNTLCFFDDHQNSVNRLITLSHLGFKKAIFEDNYPPTQGDCLSLKKVFESEKTAYCFEGKIPGIESKASVQDYLFSLLKTYCEMPPIYDLEKNRWGEPWLTYGMNEPLLDHTDQNFSSTFLEGMNQYTWLNYVELKDNIPPLDI